MVCNKEQHGVSVSPDRRIGAQSSRVEGRRKVWKGQYGEKEATHPLFVPKGIQGIGKKRAFFGRCAEEAGASGKDKVSLRA